MKKILFILFVITNSGLAWGQNSCNPVNLTLRKKWGKAAFKILKKKEKSWFGLHMQMPLYDQGQTGICYAYAAIQMVDYWRETNGLKITQKLGLSSPLYASVLTRLMKSENNFFQFQTKSLDSGLTGTALRAIRELGMCREDVIHRAVNSFALVNELDPREFQEFVSRIFMWFPNPSRLKGLKNKQIFNLLNSKLVQIEGRDFNKNANLIKVWMKIKPHIKNGDITSFMDEVFNECQKETSIYLQTKKIPDPIDILVSGPQLEQIKNAVRGLLNQKNAQPIGIGYCSQFLKDSKYIGTMENEMLGGLMTPNDQACGGHASIIIGKKEIEGDNFSISTFSGGHPFTNLPPPGKLSVLKSLTVMVPKA